MLKKEEAKWTYEMKGDEKVYANNISGSSVKSELTVTELRDFLNEIIEAGLYAASGKNRQSTKIIAVTNKQLRDRLSESNRQIGGWDEGFDPFYGAPVVLIVISDATNPNRVYDGSLVMGNLMLAAHTLGVGSCWIHRAKQEFEQDEYKKLLSDLGIEGEWEGIGHCVLGYADNEPKDLPRKSDRVYWVR